MDEGSSKQPWRWKRVGGAAAAAALAGLDLLAQAVVVALLVAQGMAEAATARLGKVEAALRQRCLYSAATVQGELGGAQPDRGRLGLAPAKCVSPACEKGTVGPLALQREETDDGLGDDEGSEAPDFSASSEDEPEGSCDGGVVDRNAASANQEAPQLQAAWERGGQSSAEHKV